MSATEKLRRMLDERGVEWKNVGGMTSADGTTEWLVDGMTCQAAKRVTFGIEHLALYIPVLTPEQVIAATLGSVERTCHAIAIYNMHDEWCADECSMCGYEWYEDEPNYCPHCGAKVVGE